MEEEGREGEGAEGGEGEKGSLAEDSSLEGLGSVTTDRTDKRLIIHHSKTPPTALGKCNVLKTPSLE